MQLISKRRTYPKRGAARRRGTMFYEATMAMVIAAAVLVCVTQILSLASQQRRATEYRSLAAYEAGNLIEDLMTRPWSELANKPLHEVPLSENCRQRLPKGRLQLEIASEGETESVRRLSIQIDWEVATDQRGEPVKLVAWRYQSQETAP
jgi:hypothetical protein